MRRIIALTLGCLLVPVGCAVRGADVPEAASLSAQDILGRMSKAYAEATSYCDTGTVTTLFVMEDRNRLDVKHFETVFVRPNRFRFAFTMDLVGRDVHGIVWQGADRIQTWWSIKPQAEEMESLGLALAWAIGISSSAAHTIPALLLPAEATGWRLTELRDAKRLDDAVLEAVNCFRIEGQCGDSPTTIWVDQRHFLVRRIDSRATFDTFRTETTTTYSPILGRKIPDTELDFNPPEAGQAEPSLATESR